MRNPYPTATGAPTLPPRLPLGHSAAPAWRGSPPPRLPQGSELAGSPRIPAKAKGFGVQDPGVPPLPACIPARASFASSCSPPPAPVHHVPSTQPLPQPPALPAKFLSGQSLPPLSLDTSGAGTLAGLGFLFLSRPGPRRAPGPLLAIAPAPWHRPFPGERRARGLPAKAHLGVRVPSSPCPPWGSCIPCAPRVVLVPPPPVGFCERMIYSPGRHREHAEDDCGESLTARQRGGVGASGCWRGGSPPWRCEDPSTCHCRSPSLLRSHPGTPSVPWSQPHGDTHSTQQGHLPHTWPVATYSFLAARASPQPQQHTHPPKRPTVARPLIIN